MTVTDTPDRKPKTIRNLAIFLALSVALIAALRIVYVYFTAVDYRSLNHAEWKTVQLGIPFIQFETPVPLEDKSRPPLGQEREFIKRTQSFVYEQGFDLRVTASVVDYLPHVYIDPEAVVTSVKNFDKQFGASDITVEPVELIIGTYKAKRVDGTFKLRGTRYAYSRVNAEYRSNYRDLLVIVRADDPEATLLKNRMVGTVFFEPQ
jgi:hypothetical protein